MWKCRAPFYSKFIFYIVLTCFMFTVLLLKRFINYFFLLYVLYQIVSNWLFALNSAISILAFFSHESLFSGTFYILLNVLLAGVVVERAFVVPFGSFSKCVAFTQYFLYLYNKYIRNTSFNVLVAVQRAKGWRRFLCIHSNLTTKWTRFINNDLLNYNVTYHGHRS